MLTTTSPRFFVRNYTAYFQKGKITPDAIQQFFAYKTIKVKYPHPLKMNAHALPEIL